MAIPESQLSRWSDHGAQESSKRTHEAIRRALSVYQWPHGMTYDFYLQGSYRNDTNIRGDSDVDVVLELTSTFKHDVTSLSQYEQDVLASSFTPAAHNWNDFRRETLKALEAGFGSEAGGARQQVDQAEGCPSQACGRCRRLSDPPAVTTAPRLLCGGHHILGATVTSAGL